MEKNYPIKIVQGNYFAIAQPLSKIVWSNGSKMEQPLVPNKGDQITVNLVNSSRRYDMRKIYVEDNIVHYECNEYLDLGTYSIELRLIQVDGKKYRSYQRNKIQIVATNEEADIKDGNEFDVDTYEISSAVILYAKGDKGDKGDRGPAGPVGPRGFDGRNGKDGKDGVTDYNELQNTPTFKTINNQTIIGEGNIVIDGGGGGSIQQIQSDWNQINDQSVDYIKNKPIIPVVPQNISSFINDVGYLTEHQSLVDYATKNWVTQQISESGTFDPSQYYTKTDIDNKGFAYSSDLNSYALKNELFSGSYNDLTDKPVIPTKISDLPNDSEYATMDYVNNMIGSISLITDVINGEVI